DAEKRRLAAAVGSHDPQPLPAAQAEAQTFDQGSVVRFAKAIHLQDDVAGAADGAEVHMRRLDDRRPLGSFQLVEGLLARLGLLVELAIMNAADVVFLPGNVFLLRLPGFELVLVALLAKPPVRVVVAGVGSQPSTAHLKYLVG